MSDMVVDGEEDKLVKDLELNLVAAHKTRIVGSFQVNGYHKMRGRWCTENIKLLSVASIKPLCIALASK